MKGLFAALKPPTGTEERTGSVSTALEFDRYRIVDDLGRIYEAESASVKYRPGDRVRTLGRQIIGPAGRAGTPKTYQI